MKRYNLKGLMSLLLVAVILIGVSSCYVSHPVHQQKTVVVKQKKAHPHGGPPGQTKKAKGHPGKHH